MSSSAFLSLSCIITFLAKEANVRLAGGLEDSEESIELVFVNLPEVELSLERGDGVEV